MTRDDTTHQPTGLELYTLAAEKSAREVIYAYSTSFGLATKLISKPVRRHIENIYAMVRVADEIVDGSAAEAGRKSMLVDPATEIAEFEKETYRAMLSGYSTNLVLHAFATSAREVQIGKEIVEPFFDSMKADLTAREHDLDSFQKYVYGSAEVVGLMCLQAFLHGGDYSAQDRNTMYLGARALGSAFQKVNFLRDLSADFQKLGRSYFPEVNVASFDEATKHRLVADIAEDIAVARAAIVLLPRSAARAVAAATGLFSKLNSKIGNTAATKLIDTRISVPNWQKLVILVKSYLGVIS